MLEFSPFAGSLPESETLAITASARRLRARGIEVAPFAAGEPDFDTPAHVKQAAIDAINSGKTKYGPAAGNAELREAVAASLRNSGFEGLRPESTVISVGAKGVLHLALQVLLREGEEVLLPAPCWLSYAKMVQAAGGRAVFVPTKPEDGFAIDPDRVRAAITQRTRAIVINSPGNPTGAVQPDEVMRAIGRLAVEHDLCVISDEIYEHLTYEPASFRSFAALAPEALDRSMIVNGVSKAYAMTGWRIGYAGGPAEWIARMVRLQSHALSGPPEITQAAALAALTGPQDAVATMRKAFIERRDVMCAALRALPDVTLRTPEGAFYVLPDVSAYLGRTLDGHPIATTKDLARVLLEEAHAAVVPGQVFEAPYAMRLSYTCDTTQIRNGVARIGDLLARLT